MSSLGDRVGELVVAVEAGGRDGHHQTSEDLKGPSGNKDQSDMEKLSDWGGQSQRVTRRDRGAAGRFIRSNEATRFWSKVTKLPGGCWVWTGAVSRDGYGRFRITISPGRYRHVKAHRWAYQQLVGPIPPGWTLDHLTDTGCTSTRCVRPDHLEPVTRADNARRAAARRRQHQETNP